MRRLTGIAAACAFVATVYAANWAITRWGPVPVGFGWYAPAGVYFAGLALLLRDYVQETLGRLIVVACILIGAALSYLIAPSFAVASGVAFLASETADLLVYTPLRSKTKAGAVLLSNTVGAVVDSALFLWLAFHSLEFFRGQVWAKVAVCLPVVAWLTMRESRRVRAGAAQMPRWYVECYRAGAWRVLRIRLGRLLLAWFWLDRGAAQMPGDDTQYVRVRDTVGGEGVAGMRLPVIRTVARRSGTHGRRAVDYLVRMPAGHHWWFRGEEVDVEHGRGRA